MSFAFAFSEALALRTDEEPALRYKIVVANGELDRSEAEGLATDRG